MKLSVSYDTKLVDELDKVLQNNFIAYITAKNVYYHISEQILCKWIFTQCTSCKKPP